MEMWKDQIEQNKIAQQEKLEEIKNQNIHKPSRTGRRPTAATICPTVGPNCPRNSHAGVKQNRPTKRKGSTPVLVGEIRRKDSTTGLTPSPPNNPRPSHVRRLSENNGRPINKKRDSIVSKGMLRNMLGSSTTQKLIFLNKIFKNSET